jgi:hypothetical protein
LPGRHKKTESVEKMITGLGWDSLNQRKKRSILCGMYRIVTVERARGDLGKEILKSNFVGKNDHQFKIKCRSQRTNLKKFSYLNRKILDWNDLPVKLLEPFPRYINMFKNKLRKDVFTI